MANVKIYAALDERSWLTTVYDEDTLNVAAEAEAEFAYQDGNGARIVMTGSGFAYDGSGVPIAGTVADVVFYDANGNRLVSYSGLSASLSTVFLTAFTGSLEDALAILQSGDDKVVGSANGENVLQGLDAGDDVVSAKGGDDFVMGWAGNNSYDGGKGFDVLSFFNATLDATVKSGVTIDVAAGTVANSWGGTDKFAHFEEYQGTAFADKMYGDSGTSWFYGYDGNDVLDGRGGFDVAIYYDTGGAGIKANLKQGKIIDDFGATDTVRNIEGVWGTSFADTFIGNGRDNLFWGFDGKDSFSGGGGEDRVSFDGAAHGVRIDLSLTLDDRHQVADDGFGYKEKMTGIEIIEGSIHNDYLRLGRDAGTLRGDSGKDTLVAGLGKDLLSGGAGADIFKFLSVSASAAGKNHDEIADFTENDTIDLRKIGKLDFIGQEQFSGDKPELAYRYSDVNTLVRADVDGDGNADFVVELQGRHALTADLFQL